MAVGAIGMIRCAVPPAPTFSIPILCGVVWLGLFFLPPCRAEENVTIAMDSVGHLRQVVGVEGMHVVVGAKTYRWDKRDMSSDDNEASVRPGFTGVVGSWRLHDNQSTQPITVDEPSPASCRASLKLAPQQTGELTYRLLQAAVVDGAGSGCPVIIEPGIYPVDRDIVISTDDATLFASLGRFSGRFALQMLSG